jgi:hypothetical protein
MNKIRSNISFSNYKKYIFLIGIFILTRLFTGYIGYISHKLIDTVTNQNYVWNYDNNKVLDIWGVWDSGYYLNIAQESYSSSLSTLPETKDQANYAFYPLYPLLIAVISQLGIKPLVSGIIISNLCLLLASFVLFLFAWETYSEKVAYASVLFLYAFPTAFIFSSVYSESLFLMLSLTTAYFINKNLIY